jgi:hypothetical protein
MAQSGQSITIKIAGDRPRTSGTGQNVKVIHSVGAEQYLAFLEGPLRAELARRYPEAEVTLRPAANSSIELVGLKPVEEIRSEIGELIGDTLQDFEPEEQ